MTRFAEVRLWGRTIGAVSLAAGRTASAFQYDPDFARSGIEVAPLVMPLSDRVYSFAELPTGTFHGLPGLLADSLPDRFGNALIATWLARQGRTPESFDVIERLCYTGKRAMGALEFEPAVAGRQTAASQVDIAALIELAERVLCERESVVANLSDPAQEEALQDILRVGTSAGGARAKAVIAWNEATGEVRSGQVPSTDGFEHWLLKFDGVRGNRDKELADPIGYGAVEYGYSMMAADAGIAMSRCRILEEGGRRHFMTKRFDRPTSREKLHMQSLGALAHFDFNAAGAHGYEEALQAIRRLGMGIEAVEEQFRRMVFNVVARNQDDHVKNIAFLMNKRGEWSLAPAFDVTYSYNPVGDWTSTHQMTIAGKRSAFTRADLRAVATSAVMKRGRAESILEQVISAVRRWPEHADAAGVSAKHQAQIAGAPRLELPKV